MQQKEIEYNGVRTIVVPTVPLSLQDQRENLKQKVTHGIAIFIIAIYGLNLLASFCFKTPVTEQLQMVALLIIGYYFGKGQNYGN